MREGREGFQPEAHFGCSVSLPAPPPPPPLAQRLQFPGGGVPLDFAPSPFITATITTSARWAAASLVRFSRWKEPRGSFSRGEGERRRVVGLSSASNLHAPLLLPVPPPLQYLRPFAPFTDRGSEPGPLWRMQTSVGGAWRVRRGPPHTSHSIHVSRHVCALRPPCSVAAAAAAAAGLGKGRSVESLSLLLLLFTPLAPGQIRVPGGSAAFLANPLWGRG